MIKAKILYILFLFFFLANIPLLSYGNTNTKERCKQLLDSANKEYSARNYAKALELFSEINSIAKENNLLSWEASVLNSIGVIYWDLLDYDKAMEYFLEVYDIAIKTSNLVAEVSVLTNMALIYSENDNKDKVFEYLKKAYDISLKSGDSVKIGEIACNIVYEAIGVNDTALAKQYVEIAKNIQISNDEFFIKKQILIIRFLLFTEDYVEAESIALSILQLKMGSTYKIMLFFHLSKIYEHKRDFENAIYYIFEILKEKPTTKEKIDAYERLSEIYMNNGSLMLALQYKDSVLQTKDLFYKTNSKKYMEASHIQIELLNAEKQLAENKTKQKIERILFAAIIVVIAILAIIFIWVFRIQSVRNKQRKQITELELQQEKNQKLIIEQQLKEKVTLALLAQEQLNNENLQLEQKLKEQETSALLEQERFNNEIELKNNQLVAKALFQSSRNKLIREIIYMITQIPNYFQNPVLESVVHKLQIQLNNSDDSDDFLSNFDQINPALFSSLRSKHPNLTVDDIHLLSYVFLYTDIRKVAPLLGLSTDACQKRKERLANKMGVKTTDLHTYLSSLIQFSPSEGNL